MQFFIGKNRGAISVFLALILLPMLIFSGIVVDVSRLYAAKTVVSGAGDLTMNAALSRYDKKLKDEYGLLAMADAPDSAKVKDTLQGYFKESCGIDIGEEKETLHSMLQMELGENGLTASGVKGTSLAETDVLRQQIMEYMKIRGPVYIVNDILEKMKKLPLKNMKEKREHIKNKTKYGKALKKIGEPLKKAKEEVEKHIDAVSNVDGFSSVQNSILEEYKKGAIFWLAARSLENYMYGTTAVPGMHDGEIDVTAFRKLLAGAKVWESEEFDYYTYADLVASIALYQSRESLAPGVTEENGFTQEEITTFYNIESIVSQSINKMDQIHNDKAAAFQSTIDSYMDQAKAIQDSSTEGVKALNEVLSVWEKQIKPAREACEESKNELIRLGEDVSDLDEELDQLEIEEKDVKSLISCLEYNGQTAKAFENYGKELKKIPQNLKSLSVDGTEGSYVINQGETDAINLFWNSHSDVLQTDYMNFTFQDASTEKFYTEVLQEIGEESEDEDAKGKQQEKKQEAKDASNSYSDLLNTLKNQDSKDLKEAEGMTYPDDFPSGIAGAAAESGTGTSSDSIDTDDEKMVDKLTKSDGFTEKFSAFLNGLDQISGKTLEKAYLMEYMTEMFNCLTTKEDDQSLSNAKLSSHYISKGEVEYILYGKSKTSENVTYAVSILYGIRLAINGIYVFSDKTLNAQASAIASSISAATGQAWLYPIIKYGYLCCVAVTYSCEDVASLAKGEEVAVWRGNKDIKMTYKEYMKLFVLIALIDGNSEERLLARTGDCIQLNTKSKLKDKYTMLQIQAEVKVSTTFLPKVPDFLGRKEGSSDGKKVIRYKSVMAY